MLKVDNKFRRLRGTNDETGSVQEPEEAPSKPEAFSLKDPKSRLNRDERRKMAFEI